MILFTVHNGYRLIMMMMMMSECYVIAVLSYNCYFVLFIFFYSAVLYSG